MGLAFSLQFLTAVTQVPSWEASGWMVVQDGAAPSQHNSTHFNVSLLK